MAQPVGSESALPGCFREYPYAGRQCRNHPRQWILALGGMAGTFVEPGPSYGCLCTASGCALRTDRGICSMVVPDFNPRRGLLCCLAPLARRRLRTGLLET